MIARTFAQMLNHKLFLGANLAKKPAERILVSSQGPSCVAKGNPCCIWTNRGTQPIEREGATDFAKADAEQISSERTVIFRNTIFGHLRTGFQPGLQPWGLLQASHKHFPSLESQMIRTSSAVAGSFATANDRQVQRIRTCLWIVPASVGI